MDSEKCIQGEGSFENQEVSMPIKLSFRALEPEDVDFIVLMENDEESIHYSERVAPISRYSIKNYIAQCDPDPYGTGQLRLMVVNQEGGRVGLLDFYDISLRHRRAMVGLIVNPNMRKQGFGKRILNMACTYANKRLHLTTLGALIAVTNKRSIKCFMDAGFREMGRFENWWADADGYCDCLLVQATTKKQSETQSNRM